MKIDPNNLVFIKHKWTHEYHKSTDKLEVIDNALKHVTTETDYLFIQLFWAGNHYPMLDLDSIESYNLARNKVERSKVPFVSVKSSNSHYWLLLDNPGTFKEALDSIDGLPNDEKYLKSCEARKMFAARACLKDGMLPEISSPEQGYSYSDDFKSLIETLNCYYSGSHGIIMKQLHQLKADILETHKSGGEKPPLLWEKKKKTKKGAGDVWGNL